MFQVITKKVRSIVDEKVQNFKSDAGQGPHKLTCIDKRPMGHIAYMRNISYQEANNTKASCLKVFISFEKRAT